ncbi:hypothetical protein ACFX1X_020614 [Malus domestica]
MLLGERASAGGEFGLGPEGTGGDDGDSADGVKAGVEASGEALGVGAVTGDGVGDTIGVLLGDGTSTADGSVPVGGVAVGGEAVGAAPRAWAMHDMGKDSKPSNLETCKTHLHF